MKDNIDKCFKGKRVSAILKKICNAFGRYTFFLLGEHVRKGYHDTSNDINEVIKSERIPNFHSETKYKSQGKLFLLKLLILLNQQKKAFSKKKYLTISEDEWRYLLEHYVDAKTRSKLKRRIKFWIDENTGVLQKAYVKKNGKKARVADGYSLTPANSHIERIFVGLGYDDKDVKDSASLKKLFNKDQKAPEILKEILEQAPLWMAA